MKAAVLYELKTPLKVEDVDLDNPKAGEVRVKIVANGCVIATIPLFTACYALPCLLFRATKVRGSSKRSALE